MPQEGQVLARAEFDALFAALTARGYTVVGPTLGDGAIVYDEVRSSADLPAGWTDEQDAGSYRLRRRDDEALFGYAVGPQSWKRYQLPPELRLWRARIDGRGGFTEVEDTPETRARYAFSELGADVLAGVPHAAAQPAEHRAADAAHARAVEQMGRRLDTTDLRDLLLGNLDHPRWDDVAAGTQVVRHQRWDSCFAVDHSAIHGGAAPGSVRARYRQWMTHKLATWIDQLGTSGCVGSGRCLTWCPIGIDITEEARAIRAQDERPAA